MNFYDPAFVTSAARPYAGGFASHEVVEIMETGLVGLDIKGISLCGMLDYNDPGETSLNNLAECAGKLYAVAAYNIASEGNCNGFVNDERGDSYAVGKR